MFKWESYLDALECHEYGHGEIGPDAAEAAYAALDALGPAGCSDLVAQAQSELERVLGEYLALEIRYDATTDHGRNEGVVLQ